MESKETHNILHLSTDLHSKDERVAECRTSQWGGDTPRKPPNCSGRTFLVISASAVFVVCEAYKYYFENQMFDVCCLRKLWDQQKLEAKSVVI